ncbi:uncharacterized protein BJ212DRAFT_1484718 [Suillus subaureus]|uniref:Uncharacterized protein n=1 Tax=Suillus subaureus TaxID=48587 RepID=A0A9P7E1M8_9AGAM|nr:uncharacterized protein BJ212DRAFT_1484718 [Suillus subaureus]KAG1808862.1 hypothetical protein BJ212DRAFT_1484718 [Suillus subaureus]
MSFKGFKYGTNRFSVRGFLAAIFHPFMNCPSDVPGVFTSGDTKIDVAQWQTILLGSDLSSRCELERIVYCKCTAGKEHEFLLLHFRHPIQQDAVAILVLDRIPGTDCTENNNGSSRQTMQSSYIISPSVSPTPARDSIFTTPNNGSAIETYLTGTYDRFKRLSYLDFTPSARPSAIQVSVLLSALSKHSPTYNLYQYQCYWYAHTVWESLKRLFPDCHETTQSGGRSRYLGVKIEKADSLEVVCEQYHTQWARIENAAEERRKAKEDEVRQLRMEGRTEERARCQAEIDQATRQKEEALRKAEEAESRAEEAERQKEEAVREAEERVRAEWQAEIDRMRAQYERQAA